MKAIKDNREYTITETAKDYYKAMGFDICDDDGDIIEHRKGKSVPYEEYVRVKQELEDIKAGAGQPALLKDAAPADEHPSKIPEELKAMSADELKAYAEVNEINIGNATTAEGILKKIAAAAKE